MTAAHWTRVRLGLAVAGFAAAVLAVAFEDRRLGWAAIALLLTSLILRQIGRRPPV